MVQTQSRPTSEALFTRAAKVLPGGVNSPVRAFRAVGGTPPFVRRGAGARITDVDGNEYIDYVGSWGPLLLGHAHPVVLEAVRAAAADGLTFGAPTEREVELAELVARLVPSIEVVRFVNSGTEAVMTALRLARGATGRSRVLKFDGGYHGHSDGLLVAAGSGPTTLGVPDSAGVPAGIANLTLSVPYNDLAGVERALLAYPDEIAAVVSHLPQILAVTLMNYLAHLNEKDAAYLNLAAGGFRDMTRVASSPFDIWRDIIATNKANIRSAIDNFMAELARMRALLDSGELEEMFSDAATSRLSIPKDMRGFIRPQFDLFVVVEDKPGIIARISTALADKKINIKDIEVVKVREGDAGTIRLAFENADDRAAAAALLTLGGFETRMKD